MKILVLHARLGEQLAEHIRALVPGADVRAVTEVDRIPPGLSAVDVLVANTFPPGLLGRADNLRWLQLTSAGTDQLDAADPRDDLVITHAGSVPAAAVAEFALMGLLAIAKDGPRLLQRQRAREWRLPSARLVAGSTLVLIGLGHVGRAVARRAAALDMRVIAVTRHGRPTPLVPDVVPPEGLLRVAARADHLVIAAPATPTTAGLVDASVIAVLPDHAGVVNVARASILDTDALVTALRAGRLSGALLDVHEQEPLPADSALWDVPRLWITPHGAFSYPGEAHDLAALVAENLARLTAGEPLVNMVDRR